MTRNSFKRKAIIFGVMIFMSIALISTGFAAWIISTNARNDKTNGNITVGKVTDKNIDIVDVKFVDELNSIVFEPKKGDDTGRVRSDKTNFENLSVTITGTIVNADILKELTILLEVPAAVKAAAAEDKGYIVLPTCATAAQKIEIGALDSENKATFTYTITFAWGSAFNTKNPGEYYDEDPAGVKVTNADMVKTLKDLRTTIYGSETNETAPQFKIILEAKAD